MKIYLVKITDNEGGARVEPFSSFEKARSYLLAGPMSDPSYAVWVPEVMAWNHEQFESRLAYTIQDDDGSISIMCYTVDNEAAPDGFEPNWEGYAEELGFVLTQTATGEFWMLLGSEDDAPQFATAKEAVLSTSVS